MGTEVAPIGVSGEKTAALSGPQGNAALELPARLGGHVMKHFSLVLAALALLAADDPTRSVPLTGPGFTRAPIPRFGYGRVVSYGADGRTVTAFRPDGFIAFTQSMDLPGSAAARIVDVAIAPDGTVAASASAQDGAGQSASVIAWFSPDGSLNRVVRATPFAPFRIAFAPDGTLWAVGRVRDQQYATVPEYDVARRYGKDGKLLSSVLPNVSLPYGGRAYLAYQSCMMPSGDGVSAFLPETGDWIDFGPGDKFQTRFRSPLPAGADAVGLGQMKDGSQVVYTMLSEPGVPARVAYFRHRPGAAQWEEWTPPSSVAGAFLFGSDGSGNLVFWDKRRNSVVWSQVNE